VLCAGLLLSFYWHSFFYWVDGQAELTWVVDKYQDGAIMTPAREWSLILGLTGPDVEQLY